MALTRKDFEPILKKYSKSTLKFKPYLKTSTTQIVNAKIQYAKGVESTVIVALFDTTFLKNGKTGYLLTLDGLYSSQFGGKVISFGSVKEINWGSGKLQVTYKNGKKADFPAETYAPDLCALIRDVLALLGTDAAPKPAKAAAKKPAAEKKPAETKESLAQKKAAIQKEMAKLEAEMAALEEETAAAKEEKPTNPEPQRTQAEMDRQKAAENREAQRNQEQDELDGLLAELDTFFDEPAAEETPTPEEKTAPASVQEEVPRKTELETVLQGLDKANQQLKPLLAAKKPVPAKPTPVPAETPAQWKRMDADTEWNFEQAVRYIMEGNLSKGVEWAKKAQAAGHPVAEQILWLAAGELDKHGDDVHLFFRALDTYGKKQYRQGVIQFAGLAEQGCADAMIALGYDAVLPLNGPVDDALAMIWRERAYKIAPEKGGVLAMIAVNIDTERRLEELRAELEAKSRTQSYTAEGAAAYHKGDYALAIQAWEDGWQHGEDAAAYNLSVLYASGKVPKNEELLCLWSRRFADMTTDKDDLLETAQRLYRNKDTISVLQTCAYCALKLAKMGDSTMMGVFELLLKRSRKTEEFELCVQYAKKLIKAGRFEGISLLTGATRALEAAREWQKPSTKYMEYVEAMGQLSGGRANKKLIATLESCANAGIGGAAFALYEIYSQGMGVREDQAQARRWAQKIKVRDAVVFGYKGKTPIFWTVLAREDNRILLLANDRLAEREFDPKKNGTWEESELRRWMNSKLPDKLFTKTEQKLIATVRNKNPGSLKYDTPRGNDTEDRLFLLSAEEVERYFATYETGQPLNRTVVVDPIAKMGTADHLSRKPGYGYLNGNNIYEWLLRTPGAKLEGYSCCVSKFQYVDSHSPAWSSNVRPALWIDLNI